MRKLIDIVQEISNEISCYCSAPESGIKFFKPLSHFGTKQAALERARAMGYNYLYSVVLNPGNIQQISDLITHTPYSYLQNIGEVMQMNDLVELFSNFVYEYAEENDIDPSDIGTVIDNMFYDEEYINNNITADDISYFLKDHNIDTLSYVNLHEDHGNISYIITDQNQIKILSVVVIT